MTAIAKITAKGNPGIARALRTRKPTVTYEGIYKVRVPLPFRDRVASNHRPALALSDAAACVQYVSGDLVLAMFIFTPAPGCRILDASR